MTFNFHQLKRYSFLGVALTQLIGVEQIRLFENCLIAQKIEFFLHVGVSKENGKLFFVQLFHMAQMKLNTLNTNYF